MNNLKIRELQKQLFDAGAEIERLRDCITKAQRSLADRLPEYVDKHLSEALAPSAERNSSDG